MRIKRIELENEGRTVWFHLIYNEVEGAWNFFKYQKQGFKSAVRTKLTSEEVVEMSAIAAKVDS